MPLNRTILRSALALGLAGLLAGCAQVPPNAGENPADPWERMNRNIYGFNDAVDRAVLKPVAKGYEWVLPKEIRSGVSRMFDNLGEPSNALNNMLQGKFSDGFVSLGRFVLNSTLGFFGFADVAAHMGIEPRREDFGQTLAVWGAPQGPYFVIPFLGPSTVRDVWSYPEEVATSPLTYALWDKDWDIKLSVGTLNVLDARSRLFELEDLRESTVDEYVAVRDAYLAMRRKAVLDGAPADEEEELESLTPLSLDDEE